MSSTAKIKGLAGGINASAVSQSDDSTIPTNQSNNSEQAVVYVTGIR